MVTNLNQLYIKAIDYQHGLYDDHYREGLGLRMKKETELLV